MPLDDVFDHRQVLSDQLVLGMRITCPDPEDETQVAALIAVLRHKNSPLSKPLLVHLYGLSRRDMTHDTLWS